MAWWIQFALVHGILRKFCKRYSWGSFSARFITEMINTHVNLKQAMPACMITYTEHIVINVFIYI